jgi:ADP-ribose pyrophosphatase
MKTPKLLSRKIIFKGKFFNVILNKVKLPNKKIAYWHGIDWTHDSVVIVPIDDNNNVYFSKEWRYAWKRKIIMLPSGGVKPNAKEAENIKQVHNELREEVGLDARKIEKLITALRGAKTRHIIHIYLATDLFKSYKKPDNDEFIEVVKMPLNKALESFLSEKIETLDDTILALILAKEKLRVK